MQDKQKASTPMYLNLLQRREITARHSFNNGHFDYTCDPNDNCSLQRTKAKDTINSN